MFDYTTFMNPPREYSLAPFWFWNDDLEEDGIRRQIQQMHEQHVYEFMIHARVGLQVPYLSDTWFSRIGLAVETAEQLGMKVWIYDEDNFPSGYAGGRVLQENSDFCGKHLVMKKMPLGEYLDAQGPESLKPVCILGSWNGGFQDITAELVNNSDLSREQTVWVFSQEYTLWNPAYTTDYYVDVLSRAATDSFIRHTHAEYEKRFGSYFGNVIRGFFTDEAGFYNNLTMFEHMKDGNTIPWTDAFPEYFRRVKGYSLLEKLPYVWVDCEGESRRVRKDLYDALCGMYRENFLEPQRQFCESRGMKFIGHLHMEDFLHLQVVTQGDFTKALDSLSYAGTDRIDQNSEKINEKLVSSMGHIYGKERVMSETYALCGWGLNFEEMKRLAHWQYVRGVNMLVPHAFYSSIEENRKWDCPPSQFFQNPYWPYYHKFADYVARMGYMLTRGEHVADVAVYYPMSSAQELIRPDDWQQVIALDRFIQEVSMDLLDHQVDFDFITEEKLVDAAIQDEYLALGGEKYKVLVLPGAINLPMEALEKLEQFVRKQGTVIFIKTLPLACVQTDKQEEYSARLEKLIKTDHVYYIASKIIHKPYTYRFNFKLVEDILEKHLQRDVELKKKDPHLKCLHRRDDGREIYFLVNEGDNTRSHTVRFRAAGAPELWNLETGLIEKACGSWQEDGYTCLSMDFGIHEAKLVVFGAEQSSEAVCSGCSPKAAMLPAPKTLCGSWKLHINGSSLDTELKSWTKLGFGHYSGEGIYEREFDLEEAIIRSGCKLELGEVADCAEVWINGTPAGSCIWEPYTLDISAFVKPGTNTIRVRIVNTLINELENIEQISGLLGPVRIVAAGRR